MCIRDSYYCALSAGCACYPDDAETYLELAKYSGYSLEYAKAHGKRRCVCFSQEILGERSRELKLVELLRGSIESGFEGFSLRYQPQIDTQTGTVTGAEALARYQCDEFGAVSPVEFIPLLEKTGLIIPMGMWVLRTAAAQCKSWTDIVSDFVMSVNLSYRQIDGDSLVPFIEDTLQESGLSPSNLVIEDVYKRQVSVLIDIDMRLLELESDPRPSAENDLSGVTWRTPSSVSALKI